jgi:hypothetical protein
VQQLKTVKGSARYLSMEKLYSPAASKSSSYVELEKPMAKQTAY